MCAEPTTSAAGGAAAVRLLRCSRFCLFFHGNRLRASVAGATTAARHTPLRVTQCLHAGRGGAGAQTEAEEGAQAPRSAGGGGARRRAAARRRRREEGGRREGSKGRLPGLAAGRRAALLLGRGAGRPPAAAPPHRRPRLEPVAPPHSSTADRSAVRRQLARRMLPPLWRAWCPPPRVAALRGAGARGGAGRTANGAPDAARGAPRSSSLRSPPDADGCAGELLCRYTTTVPVCYGHSHLT